MEITTTIIGAGVVGLAIGALMGIAYAVITLVFKAEQGISGIAM